MSFDYSYVDKAFINANVMTVNENDELAEAVGIKENKIVFVGTTKELESIINDDTEVVDVEGNTLMPGAIDSHVHPILNGFFGDSIDSAIINNDSSQCKNIKELQSLITTAADRKQPGEWISMMGYDPVFLEEERHPTLEELDQAAPNHPLHCSHISGHICMYNSKALEHLDIYGPEDAEKFPKDEVIVEDGKLTGLVRGHTHFELWSRVDYTQEQQEKAALKSQKLFLENGITSIHDCGECGPSSYHTMQQLAQSNIFKVRNYMMLHSIYGKRFSLEDNEKFMSLGLMSGIGDNHFKIGTSKFMIDGGSGAPSSATREPYTGFPDLPGERGWEREEVSDYIGKIHQAECQATAHAIGDLAIEFMVEGYENAFQDDPRPDLRHRIEHCTITDQDLIDRMAAMNICPTINTGMIVERGKHYGFIYGEKRSRYFSAVKSMLDAGIKVSIASDAPSGPMGFAVLDGAVNRKDRHNDFILGEEQAISVEEAVRCMTYNAAYASYEEDIKGSIEVGKLADITILDRDILSCSADELSDIKVEMTMIDGTVEYQSSK